jgi:hypothetical protein
MGLALPRRHFFTFSFTLNLLGGFQQSCSGSDARPGQDRDRQGGTDGPWGTGSLRHRFVLSFWVFVLFTSSLCQNWTHPVRI